MTRHITNWIEAYYDGELKGVRLRQVETHLKTCEVCRAKLDGYLLLSALLEEDPAAENLTPPNRFIAQVRLQLPPWPAEPAWQRALETGWHLAPFGLLGTWAFIQVVFVVSSVVLRALQFGLGGDGAAGLLPPSQQGGWLSSALNLSETSLSNVGQIILQMLGNGGPGGWGVTSYLLILVIVGLLYWSWLASWWAYRQHKGQW